MLSQSLKSIENYIHNQQPGFLQVPVPHENLKPPVPSGTQVPTSALLKSLQDVTTGETKTAIQLLNLLFTPHSMRVTMSLLRKGRKGDVAEKDDIPTVLGISLEVIEMHGQQKPVLHIIWEQIAPSVPPDKTAQSETSEETKLPTSFQLEKRYRDLLQPAMWWLAIELTGRLPGGRPFPYLWKSKHSRAILHNFRGSLFQSQFIATVRLNYYQIDPDIFFLSAVDEFQQASDTDPQWYLPYLPNFCPN